ncbi:hypothetical protein NL676_022892 [Syzygium grande]|nr:hypothetical protein NL676_022892 [Syzygium grande]
MEQLVNPGSRIVAGHRRRNGKSGKNYGMTVYTGVAGARQGLVGIEEENNNSSRKYSRARRHKDRNRVEVRSRSSRGCSRANQGAAGRPLGR